MWLIPEQNLLLVKELEAGYCPTTLSSAEASYFFVRAGNWGEVKSKRAELGENRNESARAPSPTEGASAEERGPTRHHESDTSRLRNAYPNFVSDDQEFSCVTE